jgi:hypothetical protein
MIKSKGAYDWIPRMRGDDGFCGAARCVFLAAWMASQELAMTWLAHCFKGSP